MSPNPRVINLHLTTYLPYPEPLSGRSNDPMGHSVIDEISDGLELGMIMAGQPIYPHGSGTPMTNSRP